MTRKHNDNSELQKIGIKIDEEKILYFDKNGNETTNLLDSVLKTYKDKYFVKYYRGTLFDPFGMDDKKINAPDIKYKEIKKDVYQLYEKYLKTKIKAHFLLACRLYNNRG